MRWLIWNRARQSGCGTHQLDILKCVLKYYIDQDFTIDEISKISKKHNISKNGSTYGLNKMNVTVISDEDLGSKIDHITKEFPQSGEWQVKHILYVRKWRLRNCLHRVDTKALPQKRRGRLQRKVYHTKAQTTTFAIETKIASRIEDFSRLPAMLKCSDNSKAYTMLASFVRAVHKHALS